MPKLSVDLDTIKRLAQFAARRSAEDRIPQVAGSLTFTTMLALVPLVTVAFALFTAFPMFASFQISLQGFLADHLMPAQFNIQIFKYLNQFAAKAKGLTTAGLIVLVVTSVMTMMTIESAFNLIWRVRKPRPFAQRVLAYWALITLGPLLFGVSLSLSSYLFTQSLAFTGAAPSTSIVEWLLTLASLPLTVLAFTLLYVYLPNCTVAWRDAVIGGLFAAVAFELAKRGFGYYVRRIPTYTAVYGAFAALPVFLLWMYLSWFIALLGAMVTSALPAIRIGQFHRVDYPGSDLLDALELLARLAEARAAGKPGRSAIRLATMLRCDMQTAQRLLTLLEEREWVARLEGGEDSPRYILLANPERLTLAQLFDVLVIDRAELTYQLQRRRSHIDGGALLAVLSSERFDVTLASLIAAHRLSGAQPATASEPAPDDTPEPHAHPPRTA
ncbi:ribonuclease BN [Burkholderia multivorans]|uniref:YihY family inner membrane protein n=1 Tax=Burkholderia multivorans TaxID=87883 RepID=UPI0012386935|nr:YihY family inner membrane protein [Burkholderia multivorans]MBU9245402.1 YihY family inner membrane protein [Burkholderia multivorans]MBU9368531.1 YihY family inner membrane protein [Burkholderia multivorans]MBU9412023.1 YihY family inner membrane protein [Burkholderia multivorans]MBU9693689.1 YihY family inner membrane protein [Burkholderia multivorans]MCO7335775.1 YihY family inner membrane protein [Burkholderia multivorans]